MVVGSDPDSGWAAQALADLGLEVSVLGAGPVDDAVEKAMETERELIYAPAALADAWRVCGEWIVAGPRTIDRRTARSKVKAAGLSTVASLAVQSAGDLRKAIEAWGLPLELAGSWGPGTRVPHGKTPDYHLALAEPRLGASRSGCSGPRRPGRCDGIMPWAWEG